MHAPGCCAKTADTTACPEREFSRTERKHNKVGGKCRFQTLQKIFREIVMVQACLLSECYGLTIFMLKNLRNREIVLFRIFLLLNAFQCVKTVLTASSFLSSFFFKGYLGNFQNFRVFQTTIPKNFKELKIV